MSGARGISFGGINTYTEWGLILSDLSISDPAPRKTMLKIPGRSGSLDLSEALTGDVVYDDRSLKAKFTLPGAPDTWQAIHDAVALRLHGRRLNIILPDDTGYYYVGRCTLSGLGHTGRVATMEITAVCEPYKTKMELTVHTIQFRAGAGNPMGASAILLSNLPNGRKPAIPKFTSTDQVTINKGNTSFVIAAGAEEYIAPGLVIAPGGETIRFTGTGELTITYQEATL